MDRDRLPISEEYLRAHTIGELTPRSALILIAAYDPAWPERFELEAQTIRSSLGHRALRIEHVGSTSVPDLPAKPIIDILLVVADSASEAGYVSHLEQAGYKLVIREPGWYEHRLFKRPADDVNLHILSTGCPEIDRMLTFRDHLRTHPDDRELYSRTKIELSKQHWKYTQNYADAKTAVIEDILSRASLG